MVYLKKNNYNIYLEHEEKSCSRVLFGKLSWSLPFSTGIQAQLSLHSAMHAQVRKILGMKNAMYMYRD